MLDNEFTNAAQNSGPSLMSRVLSSDAAKKGIASAVAGVLVAVISEVIWPSES